MAYDGAFRAYATIEKRPACVLKSTLPDRGMGLLQKRIAALLQGVSRVYAVSGDDERVVGQGGQLLKGVHQCRHVPARQVGAPDRSGKKGVAAEEKFVLREVVADAAGGVTGGFDDLKVEG